MLFLSHSIFTQLLELEGLYWPVLYSEYNSETHSHMYSTSKSGNRSKHNVSPDLPAFQPSTCLRGSLQHP